MFSKYRKVFEEMFTKYQNICEQYPERFSQKEFVVQGFKVVVFSYTKANTNKGYRLFRELDAFEMRGITFIFNLDGTIFNCNRMLKKFYNVDENEDNLLVDLKTYEYLYSNNKDDGSLIQPILLPNLNIVCKTKNCFENSQTDKANKLLFDISGLYEFTNFWLSVCHSPLYEIVSTADSEDRVVLKYPKEDLILLRIRNNVSGELVDIRTISIPASITVNKFEDFHSLEEAIKSLDDIKDKEGLVHTLRKPSSEIVMTKSKTQWYFHKHYFRHDFLENQFRTNIVILEILAEETDDIISGIRTNSIDSEDKELAEKAVQNILEIQEVVENYVKYIFSGVKNLLEIYTTEGLNRKQFVQLYSKNEFYYFTTPMLQGDAVNFDSERLVEQIYSFIKKKCYFLENAKKFVNEIKNL